MKLLIKSGRVWDGERFLLADVLTQDRVILNIAPAISENADFVFDATGMTVSAGLVDVHMHMKGISPESFATEVHSACYPFGVTAACDADGCRGNKTLLDTFGVKNLVFAEAVIENDSLHIRATEENLARYGEKAVGIKLFYDKSSGKAATARSLSEVCCFARSHGLKVLVHCNHSPTSMLSIVEALSAGDILSHVYHGGVHTCLEEDFAAFKLAREKGIVLDAGFAGHVHTDFSVLERAFSAGYFPHTLSTDITCLSAYKRGGRYGLPLCMSIARTAGMPEEAIFRAVTTTPAKAVGMPWGRLQISGIADLCVLEYTQEPFCFEAGCAFKSDMGYRCRLTVSDGAVVYRD